MIMEMIKSGVGGGAQDWITPEYSNGNKTITAQWGFDADVVFLLMNLGTPSKWVGMIDTDTGKLYYASSSGNWQYLASLVTVTKRTLTWTAGSALSEVSILPVPSVPTGYSDIAS